MLSNRRNTTSVDGGHKPVDCIEEGEYKKISTAEIRKFCAGQAEKERSIFSELKPEERASQETSGFLGQRIL